MSMRDYSVNDYGVVFTEEMIQECSSKNENDHFCDVAEEVADRLGLEYISEFTGEATRIYANGELDYKTSLIYNDDTLYYLPLRKISTLFKPAYNSMEEIIIEVTNKIGEHLPKDFDYSSNVRSIVGTYYG